MQVVDGWFAFFVRVLLPAPLVVHCADEARGPGLVDIDVGCVAYSEGGKCFGGVGQVDEGERHAFDDRDDGEMLILDFRGGGYDLELRLYSQDVVERDCFRVEVVIVRNGARSDLAKAVEEDGDEACFRLQDCTLPPILRLRRWPRRTLAEHEEIMRGANFSPVLAKNSYRVKQGENMAKLRR